MTEKWRTIRKKAAEKHEVVPDDWMPASSVRAFILEDPGQVWLEFHGGSHGTRPDYPSPYSFFDFIVDKGEQFKQRWIQENARDAIRVCQKSYHVRYEYKLRDTLQLMLHDKAPVILQPALWWAPERVFGVPDMLVHTSWLEKHLPGTWQDLVNQAQPGQKPDGYVIFELRFTTRDEHGASSQRLKPAEAQIRLNTYMLGHLQDWMPKRGYLITRRHLDDPLPIDIPYSLDQPLDGDLAQIRDQFVEIKTRGEGYLPWKDEMVVSNLAIADERWGTAKELMAWEKTPGGDPCALPRIGAGQKRELAEKGYDSIDALLKKEPAAIPLEEVAGVGEATGKEIQAILQANRTGSAVLPQPEAVPAKKQFEFFVDYEFLSNLNVDFRREWPELEGREMLFMIGVGWEEGGAWQFEVFVAEKENPKQEKKMIEAFVRFLQEKTGGAYADPEKTAIFHWTGAEQSQSSRAADRQSLPPGHAFRHLPWVDLQHNFKQTPCAVPGAWDFGLKGVAKALGKLNPAFDPEWVGVLDSGLGAMVMGWRAYENREPLKSPEMKILKQYLGADCKALWCILRWMRAGAPGLPLGAPGQTYVGWDKVKKGFSKPDDFERYVARNEGKGVFVYLQPVLGETRGIKVIEQLIWGDWVRVLESHRDWRKIYSRGTLGWVHKDFLQPDRLLEVNFVDVGQGDGCFLVTPGDKFILIDAGVSDHMYRFLRWRFRHFQREVTFEAAVITHPDLDHFAGFAKFFDAEDEAVTNVRFEHIFHNGILQAGSKSKMLIAEDKTSLPEALARLSSRSAYRQLLEAALASGRVGDIRMLCAEPGGMTYLPGYGQGQPIVIEVLGPVPEGGPGARRLPWFGSTSKTKNGNSIVFRLKYGGVSVLLGGDLNIPAEEHLLGHYAGVDKPLKKLSDAEREELIKEARATFEVDVAKSCHHGSADFTTDFLRALNAAVTVVSSGDDEPYCHPRPDTLGSLGRYGRGVRPLIYSTELARSAKENIKHIYELDQEYRSAEKEEREKEYIEELFQRLGRSVAVYGMITLRTDGTHLLLAQKLERPGPGGQKWDLHLLSPDAAGRLEYISKHED